MYLTIPFSNVMAFCWSPWLLVSDGGRELFGGVVLLEHEPEHRGHPRRERHAVDVAVEVREQVEDR
jgi:hypothetical protein